MTPKKIKRLQRMCGTYATARHLHRQGVPIELALYLLAGRNKSA